MIENLSLQLVHCVDGSLAERELHLAERETTLGAFKLELHQLQSRYLGQLGELYQRLGQLETDVIDAEIRAGLRQPAPIASAEENSDQAGLDGAAGCGNRGAPPDALKRVFRDLAKAIHPDLATDEAAQCRRHSLMAEANRAYAERDEDRLRLILSVWERSPEAIVGDDLESVRTRRERRSVEIDDRLLAIETEFADLRQSAIFRLKGKIDDARAQGWDLFGEMILQVKREIARATARLASLHRSV